MDYREPTLRVLWAVTPDQIAEGFFEMLTIMAAVWLIVAR